MLNSFHKNGHAVISSSTAQSAEVIRLQIWLKGEKRLTINKYTTDEHTPLRSNGIFLVTSPAFAALKLLKPDLVKYFFNGKINFFSLNTRVFGHAYAWTSVKDA